MKYVFLALCFSAVFVAGRWSQTVRPPTGVAAAPPSTVGETIAATGGAAPGKEAPENVRTFKRHSTDIPKEVPLREIRLSHLPPLPPLPEGVAELKFEDFYKMPVGPLGLELTEKIKALKGKRVRIAGFQVVEKVSVCNAEPNAKDPVKLARAMIEASVPGRMMVTALPESVNYSHYGLCEDLPPQVLFVTVPEAYGESMPQLQGPLMLTGTLDLGNKVEPDGRVSNVRLTLDRRAGATGATSAVPTPIAAAQAPISTTNPPLNSTTKTIQ